jgi:AraC-like DNA-binding protein
MKRADQLLRDGSLCVREDAEAIGYREPAQFAKALQRYHGWPPSAVRRRVTLRRAA